MLVEERRLSRDKLPEEKSQVIILWLIHQFLSIAVRFALLAPYQKDAMTTPTKRPPRNAANQNHAKIKLTFSMIPHPSSPAKGVMFC